MEISKEQLACRVCAGSLTEVFNLGKIYPSNFVNGGKLEVPPQPLVLVQCNNCGLVQLKHTVDLDLMYRQYWYKSSLNPSMVKHLEQLHKEVLSMVNLEDGDCVLDIGCNDGTLLSFYGDKIFTVGVDPATNLKSEAVKNMNVYVNDYFDMDNLIPFRYGRTNIYKIITSIAMFYDLPEPLRFIKDIKSCLHPDGVWVVQFQDLISMLKTNAFDNICHEHLEYYTIGNIRYMLQMFNLEIFDIEYNSINGGSLRLYITHKGNRQLTNNVDKFMFREEQYLNLTRTPIHDFYNRVQRHRNDLMSLLLRIKASNEKIYVLGASTKGNTLLQYYGIDDRIIDKALEVNPDKFGLKTVGSNIPICDERECLAENPDYLLVLPWHFMDFFNNKFKGYLNNGGRIIYPLPEVTVIRE